LARRVLHGFYPRRSGDIIVVYEAFKYLGDGTAIATHGSPYSYDTHVPLIFLGASFKPGRYKETATPADIAPTLAHVLAVQAPSNSVGRVLREGLK
jgi:arylsulfatase A-like enzyme